MTSAPSGMQRRKQFWSETQL